MTVWKIILEDLAQLDLYEAYEWYEKEKIGLGEELLNSFEESIALIERNPYHASSDDQTSRSTTLKRFPYENIYLVNRLNLEVNIIAFTHQHRSPGWYKKRK